VPAALQWIVGLVAIGLALWATTLHGTDLQVYRAGADKLLHDSAAVYRPGLEYAPGKSLPFTYPPFAALLLAPLALVSLPWAIGLHTALSVVLMYFVFRDFAPRAAALLPERVRPFCTPILLTALACWVGPFRDSLAMGQINIPLFAVVYLACVHLGLGFLSGVLVGLAGAVKLTPLALGLVPLARSRWRMIAGMGVGFFVATYGMHLLTPALSREYWLHAVRDPSRVGDVGYWDNVSFEGILARFDIDMKGLWFLVSVAVAFLVFTTLSGLRGKIDVAAQLGLASTAMIAASPISWSHHVTWLLLIVYGWVTVARVTGRCRRELLWVSGLYGAFLGIGMPVIHWAAALVPGFDGSVVWRLVASLPAAALMAGVVVAFKAVLTMPRTHGLFERPPRFVRSRTGAP
jgi:alpha-1,2-mannosyltransferase